MFLTSVFLALALCLCPWLSRSPSSLPVSHVSIEKRELPWEGVDMRP